MLAWNVNETLPQVDTYRDKYSGKLNTLNTFIHFWESYTKVKVVYLHKYFDEHMFSNTYCGTWKSIVTIFHAQLEGIDLYLSLYLKIRINCLRNYPLEKVAINRQKYSWILIFECNFVFNLFGEYERVKELAGNTSGWSSNFYPAKVITGFVCKRSSVLLNFTTRPHKGESPVGTGPLITIRYIYYKYFSKRKMSSILV